MADTGFLGNLQEIAAKFILGAATRDPLAYTKMQAQRAKMAQDAEHLSLQKKIADSQLKLHDMQLAKYKEEQDKLDQPSPFFPGTPGTPETEGVWQNPSIRVKPLETGSRGGFNVNREDGLQSIGKSLTRMGVPPMPRPVPSSPVPGSPPVPPMPPVGEPPQPSPLAQPEMAPTQRTFLPSEFPQSQSFEPLGPSRIRQASPLDKLYGALINSLGLGLGRNVPNRNIEDKTFGLPTDQGIDLSAEAKNRIWTEEAQKQAYRLGVPIEEIIKNMPGFPTTTTPQPNNLQKIGKVFIDSGVRPYTPAPETANPVALGGSVPPSTYNVSDYGPGENPVGEQIASDPGTYIPGTPGVAARPGLTNRQLMEISKYKELGLISPEMLAKYGIREQEEFKPIPGRSPGMISKSGNVKPYEGLPQTTETTYFPSQEAALNAFVDKPGFQKFGKQTKYGWTVEYKAEPKPEKPEKPQKPYYEDTYDSATGLTYRQEFMPDASGKWTVPTGKRRPVRGPKPIDKSTQGGMSDKELERKYVGAKNAWETKKKGSLATMIAESEGKKIEAPAHLKTFEAYKDWVRKGEPEVSTEKVLDESTATDILKEAGGDKNKAREIAKQRGYTF